MTALVAVTAISGRIALRDEISIDGQTGTFIVKAINEAGTVITLERPHPPIKEPPPRPYYLRSRW